MFLAPSWRKALAVPATVLLALGIAGLAASPASATPVELSVTSPAPEDDLESRVVTFSGTGIENSTVTVLDAEGAQLPGTTPTIVTDGLWTTTATYADDADTEQSALVVQTTADLADGQTWVTFELPAVAAPDAEQAFAVTSPATGDVLDDRTVVFEGTGTDGSTVTLTDADGELLPGTTAADVTDGAWTVTATYLEDADDEQSVTARQVTDLVETAETTIDVTLPAAALPAPEADPAADPAAEPAPEPAAAPAPESDFTISSPTDGDIVESLTVVVSGTGTTGSTVTVTDLAGDPLDGAEPSTVVDGAWSIEVTYADTSNPFQSVRANQTTGDALQKTAVFFVISPLLAASPVITSPAASQTIVGSEVTFTGTGEPGAVVFVGASPVSLVNGTEDDEGAFVDPVYPAEPTIVDQDGSWAMTIGLAPGDYLAEATLSSAETGGLISLPSERVEFSLIAAAQPDDGGDGLAVTGGGTTGLAGPAGAFLLAGVIALAMSRRFSRRDTALSGPVE